MVTPELKNEILNNLCKDGQYEKRLTIDKYAFVGMYEAIDKLDMILVLKEFEKRGLISNFIEGSATFRFILNYSALEFNQRGGF